MADVLARYEPLVEDYRAFRDACARPLPTVVRVNPIRVSPDTAVDALADAGLDVDRRSWHPGVLELDTDSPGRNWPYVHGWIHGQEEVSAVPPVVLSPEPGERVLDACAAPGGKATQLAGLMDDRGTLVANDASLGRLSALRGNTDRLGVTCAAVTNRDARTFSTADFGFDAFDRVLVDAPCSCEGTVRKNPDALEDWSEAYVDQVSRTQRELLRRAVQLARPGGTVVYSTCTFAPEENEAVLDHVVDREDCRVRPFDVGLTTRPGVTSWRGASYDESVGHAKRFYPHLNDTGGFFCAALEVGA